MEHGAPTWINVLTTWVTFMIAPLDSKMTWQYSQTYCSITNKPTNSMVLRLSWGTISHSATQEIPSVLQNQKVHYFVHKSLPLAPILS
jgi:hypothetical protein